MERGRGGDPPAFPRMDFNCYPFFPIPTRRQIANPRKGKASHTRPKKCTHDQIVYAHPRPETKRIGDPLAVWGRSMYSALEWTLDYFRRDPSGPPLRTSPGTQGSPFPLPCQRKEFGKEPEQKRESRERRGIRTPTTVLHRICIRVPPRSFKRPPGQTRPLLLPLFFFFPHKPFHFVHSTH